MVGAEGKMFGIWTLQIGLKCPSQALFRGKVTFKIRDFCLFVTFYYVQVYYVHNPFIYSLPCDILSFMLCVLPDGERQRSCSRSCRMFDQLSLPSR